MMSFNNYLLINKKAKFFIYFTFYLIIGLIGLFLMGKNVLELIWVEEITANVIHGLSSGFSFLTISAGFFFFLGYDYLECSSQSLKTVFKILGICLMLVLTIPHFVFDCVTGILNLVIFLLGCNPEYAWAQGLACCSYLYLIVVRRMYRMTAEHYVGEFKKLLIQMFLPIICFLIMTFFMRFSLGFLLFFIMAYVFVDIGTNRSRRFRRELKTDKKIKESNEEIRAAVFGTKQNED